MALTGDVRDLLMSISPYSLGAELDTTPCGASIMLRCISEGDVLYTWDVLCDDHRSDAGRRSWVTAILGHLNSRHVYDRQ